LDPVLVEESRSLKLALFNHKDVLEKMRLSLINHLDESSSISEKYSISSFKLIVRNVLAIGSSLANSKEVRDLFLTILERIVEPCVSFGWNDRDYDIFMTGLIEVYSKPQDFGVSSSLIAKYNKTFSRLFSAIKYSALRFMKKSALY
jgi:hypothetical protein